MLLTVEFFFFLWFLPLIEPKKENHPGKPVLDRTSFLRRQKLVWGAEHRLIEKLIAVSLPNETKERV